MKALEARVQNGRLVLDQPTSLPEGTELDLVAVDGGDDLDDEERAALHAAIEAGLLEADAGQVVEAADVIARLRAREPSDRKDQVARLQRERYG